MQYNPQNQMHYPAQQYTQIRERNSSYQMTYNQPLSVDQQNTLSGQSQVAGQLHTSNHQSSNAFMVDNILQSEPSQKTAPAADVMADEDDEMSSYMAMASSLISGGSDNS